MLSLADILAENDSREHLRFLEGPAGPLETIVASNNGSADIAVICHPHPLYQGTMHNKVVSSVAKALHKQGLATVRFNYRGVGKSAGQYDNAIGEAQDLEAILEQILQVNPDFKIYLAGFSFGAYIAATVAANPRFSEQLKQLITIAPAVNKVDFTALQQITCPWLTIAAEADEIVPIAELLAWHNGLTAKNKELQVIKDSSHFFHGKLIDLMKIIMLYRTDK